MIRPPFRHRQTTIVVLDKLSQFTIALLYPIGAVPLVDLPIESSDFPQNTQVLHSGLRDLCLTITRDFRLAMAVETLPESFLRERLAAHLLYVLNNEIFGTAVDIGIANQFVEGK